jgi:hypothetical protein
VSNRVLLSRDFIICPYCASRLIEERGHKVCTDCVPDAQRRCLTCDEMASKGWKRNHPAPTTEPVATVDMTDVMRVVARDRFQSGAVRYHCDGCKPPHTDCTKPDCACHLPAIRI